LNKGLVLVFTGNGKGKTSAALGTALRAAGHDLNVYIMQFVKGNWSYGEEKILKNIPGIEMERKGYGFVGIMGDKIPMEKHKQAAREALERVEEIIDNDKYDLVILDEINVALDLGLVDITDVIKMIEKKPTKLHLVLTGRKAPIDIVKRADVVSEIIDTKHPFGDGIDAVKGIDF